MDKNILRPWLELARVSNLPTVWTNILAAWLLAGGKWELKPLGWLLAGGSLIYTGGMFLNDAADVKFDREHRPERPIPSGRISLPRAWAAAFVFLAAGFGMFVWGAEACIWLTGALVAAIVVYDLYHKPWPGSVFIMGSCRTLLYLATASAVTGTLSWDGNREVCVKAIALGAYIVGLSLLARNPRDWWTLIPLGVPFNVCLAYSGATENTYLGIFGLSVALVAFLGVLVRAWLLVGTRSPSNIGRGVGLLLAGIVIVDALAISSVSIIWTFIFCMSTPALLLWQRKIAAT